MKNISLFHSLNLWDWAIFLVVFLFTLLAIFWGNHLKRKNLSEKQTTLELLLMGRQLTLPLFTATLVATWYGGIFGVTQLAFESGVYNFLTQGIFWYITYLIFAFFMVKKIKTYNGLTLPEMIGEMFGKRSRTLSAYFNFFNVLPIAYALSLGLFLSALFGGSLELNIALGVILVMAYSCLGGLRAVVFSDLVQFVVMCLSVFLILVFSYSKYGGLSFLKSHLPSEHFSLLGGHSLLSTLVWGLIALSTLVDPNFYTRVLAAKSEKTAKRGILISTVVWFCFDICTTGGALYARATMPEAASETAYLIYAIELLPHGLRGFVLAGILATILSTLDSYLFLAGSTITYDLLSQKVKHSKKLHYLGICFAGVLAIVLSFAFNGNIKNIWKLLGSYSAACLLLPVTLGHIFPKKISDHQFVFSCLMGVVGTSFWELFSDHFQIQLDSLYIGSFFTCIGLISFPYLFRFKYEIKTNEFH